MNSPKLILFTQPQSLAPVGHKLLARLFDYFKPDLAANNCNLPNPDLSNDAYFDSLACVLETAENLPAGVLVALNEIEELAANPDRLSQAIAEASGELYLNGSDSPLLKSIHLWLASHDRLRIESVNSINPVNACPTPPPN